MPVAPPYPRLPSLNALRAFEAAARLGGFVAAADELQVTPGAVSAQIKSLEDELGGRLFERHARGVRLTALGARALPGFVDAFDRLGDAVRDLRQDAAPHKVHVAALPALAQLWLAPRLPALRTRLPETDISVTALELPPNLKRVPFDLCLFYARDIPERGLRLADDEILPVCAPQLADTLDTVSDLRKATCLTDSAWADDWTDWAAAAMPGQDFVPRGPVFSLYALAMEEALNGAGVLIARRALAERHLASGALVAPFDVKVPVAGAIVAWTLPGGPSGRAKDVADALKALA